MQLAQNLSTMEPGYFSGLNPSQKEAVLATDGAVLVLAGAGTGKTKVLTTRLAHILQTGRAWPSQILAVTFTNRAAQEMKERVSALLNGQPVEGWWLGTFHSLAARMLRRHADLVGLTSAFTIIDPDDQQRLLKQIMEIENIDHKKWPPRQVISHIDRWKDKGLRPEDVGVNDGGDVADGKLRELYRRYQERLKQVNACDFGDLLLHMITILKDPKQADVLADYHRRFKYILVDEYQDTNVAQYMWLRLLAKKNYRHPERSEGANADPSNAARSQDDIPAECHICCVGDDDQSIYGWRGAEVGNILRFEKDFPGAKIIRLEQNYRSTGHILSAANGVIAQNEGRLGKNLFTTGAEGEKITVRGLWDGAAEARWASEEIEALQRRNWKLSSIAILVRAGFQTREFEERFIQMNLPYRVIGGQRFYERQEIRDALAYFRVIVQPADDLALERIMNTPKRGLGDSTLQQLYAYSRASGVCLYKAIEDLVQTDEVKPKAKAALDKLISDFNRWRTLLGTAAHTTLGSMVLEESGYIAMWQADKSPDSPGRVENLRELITGMAEFESMQVFLEHVALVLENQGGNQGESLSIMTLHGAKGLEFDAVFLPGWEEGLFPSQKTMDEHGIKGLEEERRLAYVGLTRARKKAYVSFVANRRQYGNWISAIPSRFVTELPEENTEIKADTGLYGEGRSRHWDSSGIKPHTPTPSTATHRTAAAREENDSVQGFQRGARVFHDKFGSGTITNVDGHKLDIKFDVGGHKRVMDSFVKPTSDNA